MKNLFNRLSDAPISVPKGQKQLLDQLNDGKLPQLRNYPVQPPEHADDELKEFYRDTECLQPVLNRSVGSDRIGFNEVDNHYVTLGTLEGTSDGRTYEVFHGSVVIGKIAIVPNCFRLSDETDWADLRIRLTYPVEILDGKTVHGLLTGLIKLTQEFENDTFEGVRDDPRASVLASQALVEAMWDCMREPNDSAVIELNIAGPWSYFKNYVSHWRNSGMDPWATWKRNRDE